jgi:hypothetical protein
MVSYWSRLTTGGLLQKHRSVIGITMALFRDRAGSWVRGGPLHAKTDASDARPADAERLGDGRGAEGPAPSFRALWPALSKRRPLPAQMPLAFALGMPSICRSRAVLNKINRFETRFLR